MSLKDKTLSAVKWNLLSTVITVSLGIILLWALSHLLSSEQYGIISAAVIIAGFFNMLLDFGISNSIIRSKSVSAVELKSLSVVNISLGFVAFLFSFSFSDYLADIFNAPHDLSLQIKIMSFGFVFLSFGLQPKALLTKDMLFSTLSKVTIVSAISNFVVAIVLALIFKRSWCVAFAFLVSTMISSCMLRFYSIGMSEKAVRFDLKSIRIHIKYGVQLVLDSLVNQVSINTYPVLMSRLINISAIGGYNIAYNISISLFEKLNPVLSHALFPAFSRISGDESKLKKSFLKVTSFSSFVNFPMLFGMLLISPYVVKAFFDSKWDFIIPIVQVLCLVGVVRSLDTPVISILLVKAKMYRNVYLGLMKLLIGIPLTWYLGKGYGIFGIVIGFLLVQVFNTFLGFFYLLRSAIDVKVWEYCYCVFTPLLHVLPMLLVGSFLKVFFMFENVYVGLFSTFFICVFIYVATIFISPINMVKDFRLTVLNSFFKKNMRIGSD